MADIIKTHKCGECGRLAPVDAPHACREDRREVLRDTATLLPSWVTASRAGR
jgi:hypothetical protein